MLDAKKWMYIPSNSTTWLVLMKSWMSKAKTWLLHESKLNVECKKVESRVQTPMANTKCRIDCVKYNVKWNIEFWRKWNAIKVQLQARNLEPPVLTPINIGVLAKELSGHPDSNFVANLINSLRYGTHVSYLGPRNPQVSRNLQSAAHHPDVDSSNLTKEIGLGLVAGPFRATPPPPQFPISNVTQ